VLFWGRHVVRASRDCAVFLAIRAAQMSSREFLRLIHRSNQEEENR
jgi:hypothetical protein